MPFVKGNTIGKESRFKTGQSGNPAGRPPDKLRRHIYAELDKIEREATGKHEAVTKLQVLAERIVADAIAGCIASRKMLVERLYPMLNRHEIAGADGGAFQVEIEAAARELDRLLGLPLDSEAPAEH